jgi:hypothetical protein
MTFAAVPDVALFIGKSERTLKRWVDQGLLEQRRDVAGRRTVCVQEAIRVESEVRTRNRARPPAL